jgi:hypothetical protein
MPGSAAVSEKSTGTRKAPATTGMGRDERPCVLQPDGLLSKLMFTVVLPLCQVILTLLHILPT